MTDKTRYRVKRKRDEEGKLSHNFRQEGVKPHYNFSDWQTQAQSLKVYVSMWNQWCMSQGRDYECIDPEKIVRTMIKRVAKHNGLISKYDGKGALRDIPV